MSSYPKKSRGVKRERSGRAWTQKAMIVSPSRPMRRIWRPGFDRTGGSYGRYQPRGGELKFFDTTNSFNFDATGEVPATGQLNLIPQGTGESARIGRLCRIRSILMRGSVVFTPAAAATATTTAYMLVVLDTQCNGEAATVTDVMTSNNLSGALTNLNNSQRFRILKRFQWNFQPSAGVSGAYNSVAKPFQWFKKCNILLDFSSTTGAITEIRSNNVFLLASSDGLIDDTVALAGTTRVRFSDY